MRGFAHVVCLAGVVVAGLLNACSAQEGVLLHIELTSDPTVLKIDHLQLYVARQVNPGSSFPEFAPGGPTFERETEIEPGVDQFLLSEYNANSAFDLMLPAGQLPLWPESRQVLIVGSIKNRDGSLTAVAWGASKVGGTAGRVNRYEISMRAVDDAFDTAPGCVAWNAGLVIDVGAQCPGPVCVPQDPAPGFVDTVCDGIDADCNSEPAVVNAACMRPYPSNNGGGRLCNLIKQATCTELETDSESYLCDIGDIEKTTCLSIDHCNGAEANGRYTDSTTMNEPVANVLKKINAKCDIPVDAQGVPCGPAAKRLKFTLGMENNSCFALLGDRYVDPDYANFGAWTATVVTQPFASPCESHFELISPQDGELTQGTVLLGVHRKADQLKVGLVVEIRPTQVPVDASFGLCLDPSNLGLAALCTIDVPPTACFQ